MLQIVIPELELFDDSKNEFVTSKEQTLQLEHSLVSLSKWESKWCKAFFSKREKTYEETLDYIKCMTLTQNVPDSVYKRLTRSNVEQINRYIESPMSATHFRATDGGSQNRETITSELIYYWMIALNIPFECQKWHINRLLTLVRLCNIKNQPPRTQNKRETINQYAALNEARRKQFNSKG